MNHSAHSHPHQVLGFVAWLALCAATAAVGSIASANAGEFYATLSSPSWAPPAWLFGPVWSALYFAMAVAAWLVWRVPGGTSSRSVALNLFVIQLALNALWSWLFFEWRLGGVAFAEVLLLWLLIACTIGAFWRVKPIAALLLVPYLLWVSFASALNFVLWRANPAILG